MTYGEAESNLILDRLVNQWAFLNDEQQIDAQVALMAPNGTYQLSDDTQTLAQAAGQAALKDLLTQRAAASERTFTLNGSHLMTLNLAENTAKGILYAQIKRVHDHVLTTYSVRYDDQYAFIARNWVIQTRHAHLMIVESHPLA